MERYRTEERQADARAREAWLTDVAFRYETDHCASVALIALFGPEPIDLRRKDDRQNTYDTIEEIRRLAQEHGYAVSYPTSVIDFISELEKPACRGAVIIMDSVYGDEVLHYMTLIPTWDIDESSGTATRAYLLVDVPSPQIRSTEAYQIANIKFHKFNAGDVAEMYGYSQFMTFADGTDPRSILILHDEYGNDGV